MSRSSFARPRARFDGAFQAVLFRFAGPLGWLSWVACGGGGVTPQKLHDARALRAVEAGAAQRAPELFAHHEEAQQHADAAPSGSPARADYEAAARLWLEAAIAEAERSQLSEARLALERETAALEAQAFTNEQERQTLAERAQLEAARRVARREQELALTRAALSPQQRTKLGRPEVEQAAQALCARAALVLLALRSYGGPEPTPELDLLDAKLARARAALPRMPDEALHLADQTLFEALARLGELRGSAGAPSDLERASLAEALSQTGTDLARNDRGLAALIAQAYQGPQLTPTAQRLLTRLCALADAHARGPVQLVTHARSAAASEARASGLRERLPSFGCAGQRFRVEAAAAPAGDPRALDDLELTWLAY